MASSKKKRGIDTSIPPEMQRAQELIQRMAPVTGAFDSIDFSNVQRRRLIEPEPLRRVKHTFLPIAAEIPPTEGRQPTIIETQPMVNFRGQRFTVDPTNAAHFRLHGIRVSNMQLIPAYSQRGGIRCSIFAPHPPTAFCIIHEECKWGLNGQPAIEIARACWLMQHSKEELERIAMVWANPAAGLVDFDTCNPAQRIMFFVENTHTEPLVFDGMIWGVMAE
jgi:hypothetical protein